jgi:hypothetical protein
MLGSITPLGERSRGSHWWNTFGWFVAGSVGGGALVGLALGALGSLVIGGVDVSPRARIFAATAAGSSA